MTTTHLNPAGAPITTCEGDEACEIVSCELCLIEIPTSVAESHEGTDYVHHFCGLECLGKWQDKLNASKK
jgi:hypothetical protein